MLVDWQEYNKQTIKDTYIEIIGIQGTGEKTSHVSGWFAEPDTANGL